MRSRSPRGNLACILSWCTCIPALEILGQIFFEIMSRNSFHKSGPCDLENEIEVTRSELDLFLPWCTCLPGLAILGQIFLEIMSGNGFHKSDPCDLENEVKVTQSELDLHPDMVHLCTRFGSPNQIFLEIMSGNGFHKSCLSVTLKIRSRSPRANLTCVLPWCTCLLGLVILGQIFLEMSGNSFHKSDPCDIENEVKVTRSKLDLCPFMVHLYARFGDPRSIIS